jgi:hypothetical protein
MRKDGRLSFLRPPRRHRLLGDSLPLGGGERSGAGQPTLGGAQAAQGDSGGVAGIGQRFDLGKLPGRWS